MGTGATWVFVVTRGPPVSPPLFPTAGVLVLVRGSPTGRAGETSGGQCEGTVRRAAVRERGNEDKTPPPYFHASMLPTVTTFVYLSYTTLYS